MMEISAAVLRQTGGPLTIETVELADPRPDEVLVRVVSSGICHTDIGAMGSSFTKLPMVLGHEGAGIVERVGGDVTRLKSGDKVVLSFDWCGVCDRCRAGMPSYCREFRLRNFSGGRPDGSSAISANGERIGGHYFGQSSFATHVIARETNAVPVGDVPIDLLGPLGCGVQTGAGAVIGTFKARPGSTIAVFGTGSVGLSAVLGAVVSGCTTIVGIDLVESRLAMARELGATHVISGNAPDVAEQIQAITRHGVDFAFETTGVPAVVETAVRSLDELGTLGMVGGVRGGRLDMPFSHLARGRSIRTIIEGDSVPTSFVPLMVDLWRQGRFPFDKLVTRYPFDQINEAAHASDTGAVIKPVLQFA